MVTQREQANAIRALSMDAVQRANSGHPGMPMGMADIAQVLWSGFLRHDPGRPDWPNRDRFVLSNGHGSMLLYSILHLTGYELTVDDLKNFRQLHSKTPGHPEYGYAPGVETTTGPLGQGFANAVGMALAERMLAAHYNRPGHTVIDHDTYVFLGDGCLMEGISHEAASLAGTLGLGKLTAVYDDNGISIDGAVEGWFTENTAARFAAYGWHVIADVDGHDAPAVATALRTARAVTQRPSLVCCKTIIGYGSPNKQGKESSHGAALGADEVALARDNLGWPHPPFEIPEAIYAAMDGRQRGHERTRKWDANMQAYRLAYPALADELERRLAGALPAHWPTHAARVIATIDRAAASIATRSASRNALEAFGPELPELAGGSADLAGSNLTIWSGSKAVTADDADGNYIYFGVREFAMAAIANGMVLHGGFIPYAATFLMFSEYQRNALRMAALMRIGTIFVFTHDSIGLGEDGPTHQAVEQTATLRLMPNMSLWRPCDAVESAVAWQAAVERRDGPTSLLFSRQELPHQARTAHQLNNIKRGGYELVASAGELRALIIATGSEVALAVAAAASLNTQGIGTRVVSMPSVDVFKQQPEDYRNAVLPPEIRARVAVEAGVTDGWYALVGLHGAVVGLDTFGESGPAAHVFEHFGFTAENVADTVRRVINS
ncbi:MAG: transketolase [Gammaproteobacteria bacterium]|nr:transketolase [Gammaproteobacteria bacterium]